MRLQGDLQKVFDALYHLGAIDPVLEMDWASEFKEIEDNPYRLADILGVVNSNLGNYQDLMDQLKSFDKKELGYLAMMVGQELASFHGSKVIH